MTMKKIITLLIISLGISGLINAKELDVGLIHTWMNDNYEVIETNLYESDASVVVPTLNTLIDLWLTRDGSISGEVSPLIAVGLKVHPELTLQMLSVNKPSFERWLDELDGMVFTDHSGHQIEQLEKLRIDLIHSLQEYSLEGSTSLTPMSQRLIEKLNSIEIRVIE